jgi:hypothetical protein
MARTLIRKKFYFFRGGATFPKKIFFFFWRIKNFGRANNFVWGGRGILGGQHLFAVKKGGGI